MRVLVAADNLLARAGLVALLESVEPADVSLDLTGQSAIGPQDTLLADLDVYRPDVVVIDLGYEPSALLPRLLALAEAQMPFVALVAEPAQVSTLNAALVDPLPYALLPRDSHPETLAAAVTAVHAGLVALDPEMARALQPPALASTLDLPLTPLTPRENEVLQLLVEGLTNKGIAQRLAISPNTVKFHINAILSKLDAQSRTEAVVRATRLGLVML